MGVTLLSVPQPFLLCPTKSKFFKMRSKVIRNISKKKKASFVGLNPAINSIVNHVKARAN